VERVWDYDLEEWGLLDRKNGIFISGDDGAEYDALDGDVFLGEDGRKVTYGPETAADRAIREAADETAETQRANQDWIDAEQARAAEADELAEEEAEEAGRRYTGEALASIEERKALNRTIHRDLLETEEGIGRKLDAGEREDVIGYVRAAHAAGDTSVHVGHALDEMYPDGIPDKTRVQEVADDLADQQVAQDGGETRETAAAKAAATGVSQDYSVEIVGYDEEGEPRYRAIHDETGEAL
jgi:hypothetical protein